MESRKQRSTATDRKSAEGPITDSRPTVDHDSWGRLSTVTGIAGIAGMVLLLGSFLVCCGWVLAATAALPRWTGWLAIVAGIGLVLARFAWTTPVWFLPYALFWLWMVCVCVYLLRHRLQATG